MRGGKRKQLFRQLAARPLDERGLERRIDGWRLDATAAHERTLPFNPVAIRLHEGVRLALDAPSGQRDTDAAVSEHPQNIAPGATMADQHDMVARRSGRS